MLIGMIMINDGRMRRTGEMKWTEYHLFKEQGTVVGYTRRIFIEDNSSSDPIWGMDEKIQSVWPLDDPLIPKHVLEMVDKKDK